MEGRHIQYRCLTGTCAALSRLRRCQLARAALTHVVKHEYHAGEQIEDVATESASDSDFEGHPPGTTNRKTRRLLKRQAKLATPRHRSQPLDKGACKLHHSAYYFHWSACTVRGQEDGSLLFKFDEMDPLEADELEGKKTLTSWGSVSIKLGVKFPKQMIRTVSKLDHFVEDFPKKGDSAEQLDFRLFKPYGQAFRRRQKLLGGDSETESDSNIAQNSNAENGGAVARVSEQQQYVQRQEHGLAQQATCPDDGPAVAPNHINDGQHQQEHRYHHHQHYTHSDQEHEGLEHELQQRATQAAPALQYGDSTTSRQQDPGYFAKTATPGTTSGEAQKRWIPHLILTTIVASTGRVIKLWFTRSCSGIWRLVLACYRLLPYRCRSLFHRPWPPTLSQPHASPILNRLLQDKSSICKATLEAVGFDSSGCWSNPLHDLERWQVELLLGTGIGDVRLYRRALTHTTTLIHDLRQANSYERLEFLGDAVLELCTRQVLMQRAPEADEGELTMKNQTLVSGSTLHEYGKWLGLDRWLVMNIYSLRDDMAKAPAVLADVFEALVGAVYLDKGFEAACSFILRVLENCPAGNFNKLQTAVDYKGTLSRTAVSMGHPLPVYQVKSCQYMAYQDTAMKRKFWEVQVVWDKDNDIRGAGKSFEKREAEQEAAREVLMRLGELNGAGSSS